MKRIAVWVAGLAVAVAVEGWAQQGEDQEPGGRPPERRGEQRGGPGREQALTAEQVAQVKAILAKYDPATLTADQARAIHEAFRQAGLRGGRAMGDAIKAAGFDPEKLRDLAPPPERPQGEAGGRRGGDQGGPDGAPQDEGEGSGRKGAPADETMRNAGGDPADHPARGDQSSRTERHGQKQYTLSQAISDRAQLSTIAFSGLAFLTGDFGAATFMPPGKVCDYFGFQYMRDIDAAGKGHNPVFLSRVAANVIRILDTAQRKRFEDLAGEQAGQFEQLALKRMPLIKAFQREKDGDLPKGTTGLSREAVMRYAGDFFAYDAELSYRRAEVFGKVVASLTSDQKAALAAMKFGDFNTWPELDERSILKRPADGVSKFYNVAYMTYASEFFSWYAGSVKADVYFCPERHGTYFGSFYMKDMPAMGKRNYDISTAVTGDSGEAFLKLLSDAQREPITSIIARQKGPLAEMIQLREAVSTELRKFLAGGQADKQKVLALGKRYGELDGEVSWMYAMAYAKVNRTLTAEQRATMVRLRNLDGYRSAPAYLYSSPMPQLPQLPDTDFLFTSNSVTAASGALVTPLPATGGQAVRTAPSVKEGFILRSGAVADGGRLPKEYTGFGESATLPLEWSGAPAGTKSFALVLHHVDPQGKTKWYWVLYNIPPGTVSLPRNVTGVGTLGNNSVNGQTVYAPPHSKGPGDKTYIYTVYALSAPPVLDVPPSEVSRDKLLAAMQGRILGEAEMKVVFARPVEL